MGSTTRLVATAQLKPFARITTGAPTSRAAVRTCLHLHVELSGRGAADVHGSAEPAARAYATTALGVFHAAGARADPPLSPFGADVRLSGERQVHRLDPPLLGPEAASEATRGLASRDGG
jgi:hypothetical protein